ncbi:MAG: hypothetical protein WBG28_12495, partial [Desulfobulbales bacterium]
VKARKQLAKVVSELSRTNEKTIREKQEAVDQVAEKTENYNSQRAAKLYQLIIAEQKRRESTNNIISNNHQLYQQISAEQKRRENANQDIRTNNNDQQLYQQISAEQQQRENANQDIRINSDEMSENAPEETQATAVTNSVADKNKKNIHARVARLKLEIERLTERIENGLSDRDYERYMQLKSPVYVIHDSERLEAYQTELDKLLLEMTSQ